MIDTKALRSRVLDLAIQGRLTEQLESDGTAEELYQQIQTEKQRLVKEGKIKKEKPLPEIKPEEVPFEIPKSWKWVRMGAVYSFNPSVEADENTDAAFIPMERISAGYKRDFSFEVQKWSVASKNHTKFSNGDVAFAKITPCFENRKSFVAEGLPNAIGGGTTELIILRQKMIFAYYTYLLIINQRFIDAGVSTYKGTAGQQRVKNDALKQYSIPLPPLAEQKRIVSRVEEIFRLLDTIDEAQKQYAMDVGSLKAKLITAGIQGKLTEQLDSDGTAEELYQQIQEEKQRLIKEGKIKKEKPLPEIKPEEVPFEIPGNWKWVRLGDISNTIWAGRDKPDDFSTEKNASHSVPVVANGVANEGILGYTAKATAPSNSITVAGRGTIGFSVYRTYEYCPIVRLIVIEQSIQIDPKYLQYFLMHMPASSVGSSIPQLTVPMIRPKLIPLPPLAEQKRIAEKLDAVLGALS